MEKQHDHIGKYQMLNRKSSFDQSDKSIQDDSKSVNSPSNPNGNISTLGERAASGISLYISMEYAELGDMQTLINN